MIQTYNAMLIERWIIKAPQKMWDEDHSSAEEQWNKRSSKDPDDQIWD